MKLKNRKNHSYLYYSRLNEKSRLKFQPYLTLSQREKEREREYRKKTRKEGRKLKRSFGRYSPSFSDLPCPNLKKKKREEVESRGWPRKERGKKGLLLLVLKRNTRIPVYLSMISLRFSIGTESGAVDFAPADIPVKSDKPQKAICQNEKITSSCPAADKPRRIVSQPAIRQNRNGVNSISRISNSADICARPSPSSSLCPSPQRHRSSLRSAHISFSPLSRVYTHLSFFYRLHRYCRASRARPMRLFDTIPKSFKLLMNR